MLKGKTIVFDFFGVICSEISPSWFKKFLPERPDLKDKYCRQADLGEISEADFFGILGTLAKISPEEVRSSWLSGATVNDQVVRKIKELKDKYNIILASNSPSPLIMEVLKNNNLEQLFDKIIISAEIGLAKPDRNFFDYVLKFLGQSGSGVFFFDDNKDNVKSAQSVGIKATLFSGPEDIKI